jgi:hypothetical protein
MPNRYSIVSDEPPADTIGDVDVLSDVIAVMRMGEPRSARVEWHAP